SSRAVSQALPARAIKLWTFSWASPSEHRSRGVSMQRASIRHYNRMSMALGTARIFRKLLISLALTATAHCQTSRGTVTGTVLDPSGAAIKDATITLTGQQTGIRLATGSNEAGVYRFDAVDLAVYDLQVEHP